MRPLLILFLLLAGCSKHSDEAAELPDPVLSQQYRQNNILVILSVSETNIPTSGKIQLLLEAHTPQNQPVIFPEIEPLIAPFTVGERYTEPVQTQPGGKQLSRRVWWLVPKLPGQAIFQSLEIKVGATTVKTDPVAVRVTSLLPQGLETFEIKDIVTSMPAPPAQKKRQLIFYIALTLTALTALTTVLIRLVRRPKKIIVLSAHETAAQSLKNLPDDPLARLQEIHRILLSFMERYFNCPMVGKTTKQIIPLIPEHPLLNQRSKLIEFLTDNDLVRFSNRIPGNYVLEAEAYVRQIIEEMKEEERCV